MTKPTDLFYKLSEANPVHLTNIFSFACFNIPININDRPVPFSYWEDFMETLERVKMETKYLKASLDYKVIIKSFLLFLC